MSVLIDHDSYQLHRNILSGDTDPPAAKKSRVLLPSGEERGSSPSELSNSSITDHGKVIVWM